MSDDISFNMVQVLLSCTFSTICRYIFYFHFYGRIGVAYEEIQVTIKFKLYNKTAFFIHFQETETPY